MMSPTTHGVAHIKIGRCAWNIVGDFYAVIFRGVLQPTQYGSFGEAMAAFNKMDGAAA